MGKKHVVSLSYAFTLHCGTEPSNHRSYVTHTHVYIYVHILYIFFLIDSAYWSSKQILATEYA